MITELRDIESVLVLLVAGGLAESRPKRGDQRDDLLRGDQLVEARALDVEDLSPQRQDRLELAIAALLRRPTGGIAFDQIYLAQCGIALLTVGELAGQPHAVEHPLAPCQLARLARRLPCARRLDDLAADDSRVARVFEQELVELATDDFLHDRLHLGRDELVLGLR